MSDTSRVQELRNRLRDEGKAPVTVWLSREEKRRLEALAKTWHCSTSELVGQALSAYQPASPPVTAAITDTAQLRQCITETVADIVTATLPALVREIVEAMAQEHAATPIATLGNRSITVAKPPKSAATRQPRKAAITATQGAVASGADTRQTENGMPSFDTSKYTLGTLCPRGHDYQGTGKTLRRLPRHVCPECDREQASERRQGRQG
jgi:hypothetical protein